MVLDFEGIFDVVEDDPLVDAVEGDDFVAGELLFFDFVLVDLIESGLVGGDFGRNEQHPFEVYPFFAELGPKLLHVGQGAHHRVLCLNTQVRNSTISSSILVASIASEF